MLVKEKVCLDQSVNAQTTQVLLEGDLIVSDSKPDINNLLQTDSEIFIEHIEVSNERVNFTGSLNISILYLAKDSLNPVHSMKVSAPIDDFINMDSVTNDMWLDSKAIITNIDFRLVNDRKINYRALVDVTFLAQGICEHEIITDIDDVPKSQLEKSSLMLNRTIENKVDNFIIKGDVTKDNLTIPSGKPNIREILDTKVTVSNKDARVLNGRVNVNGELKVAVIYRGDNDASIIELTEHEIPFNGNIEIPSAKDGMFADVSLFVQDKYVKIVPDSYGEDRSFDIEATIKAVVKVTHNQTIEILTDAYCINKTLNISKAPVVYNKLICHNKTQSPIKDMETLDNEYPDILQIFSAKGKAFVSEVNVLTDKIMVKGRVEADVLYVAQDDSLPLHSFEIEIPYEQVIETKGSMPDMNVNLDANVDHVSFNMLSGRELELRLLLCFNTTVTEQKSVNLVTDIQFDEMDKALIDSMASITVYTVQRQDDIFTIAKKYNTSIDDLLLVNEIENPAKIFEGQKLLILKKVV